MTSGQNYQTSQIYNDKIKFLGLVKSQDHNGFLKIEVKSKIEQHQKINIISPDGNNELISVEKILTDDGIEKTSVHSGSGIYNLALKTNVSFPENSILLTSE